MRSASLKPRKQAAPLPLVARQSSLTVQQNTSATCHGTPQDLTPSTGGTGFSPATNEQGGGDANIDVKGYTEGDAHEKRKYKNIKNHTAYKFEGDEKTWKKKLNRLGRFVNALTCFRPSHAEDELEILEHCEYGL